MVEKSVADQIKDGIDAAMIEAKKFKPSAGAFVLMRGSQVVMSSDKQDDCEMEAAMLRSDMRRTGHDLSIPEHAVRVGRAWTTEDNKGEIKF